MSKHLHRPLLLLIIFLGVSLISLACANIFEIGSESGQLEPTDNRVTATSISTSLQQTSPSPEPTPTPLRITGSVIDGQSGDPLPATTIYLSQGNNATESTSVNPDNRGFFKIQNLDFPLSVRAEAAGYKHWETTFNSPEQLLASLSSPLEIKLAPQVITGTIHAAETDAPLAGVTLRVESDNNQQTATTDANGAFELSRLQPNDTIKVDAPPGFLPLQVTFSDQQSLDLTLQPRNLTVNLVNSFTKEPVAAGLVTVNQTLTTTTNAQGQATLTQLPESGQLAVSKAGYVPTTVEYQAEDSVEIVLFPAGLQGVIRGADSGDPLSQTAIYWGDTYFRTDENGRFVLDSLPNTPTRFMLKSAGYHRTYAQISQTGIVTDYRPAPFSGGEGRWLTTSPCIQPPQSESLPCVDISLEPFDAKAIYIPLHFLRSRERMIGYLDFIAATELNAIVVDVKGDFGFIAWDSDVELASEVGSEDWFTDTWMPLDEFIAEARARNIYTIARMVVFKDDPLAHGKPELAVVREDGSVWLDGEELGWANPFREEVWAYNIELAKEVADFGFDELNVDYIRFPSDGDVGAIVYEEENTLETRTTAIRDFMTRLSEALRPTGVFLSADVFGLTLWVVPDSDMRIGQRVIDIAPQVDYLAPMVYPSTFGPGNLGYDNPADEPYGVVYRSQERAKTLVPPYVKVRPWLQGYWYSLEEMRLLKQAAIDSDSTGWTWWNAGGKYDAELYDPAEEAK